MSTVVPEIIHGVSLVCRREGRFLLVERGKEPWKGWLAFPGGGVEPGETPEDAARRELAEETALAAARLAHVVTLDLALEGKAYARSYFLAVYRAFEVTGEARAGDDAAAIRWLTVDEMVSARVTDSTLDVARQIAAREDEGREDGARP